MNDYSGDEIPILRLHGSELTPEFFNKHGFDTPILVEKKDGLSLTVPPRTFTIQDVENFVGKYVWDSCTSWNAYQVEEKIKK